MLQTLFRQADGVPVADIAVAGLGLLIAVLFFFSVLPEITEEDMALQQEAEGLVDDRPIWKRWHCVFGFVSQFVRFHTLITLLVPY